MVARSKFLLALPCFVMIMAGANGSALADGKGSRKKERHDDLYEARKSGTILPLAEILERLRPVTGPEVVDIEFETKHDVPVYEIKYVDKAGRRKEIYVDARTAAVVEIGDD